MHGRDIWHGQTLLATDTWHGRATLLASWLC